MKQKQLFVIGLFLVVLSLCTNMDTAMEKHPMTPEDVMTPERRISVNYNSVPEGFSLDMTQEQILQKYMEKELAKNPQEPIRFIDPDLQIMRVFSKNVNGKVTERREKIPETLTLLVDPELLDSTGSLVEEKKGVKVQTDKKLQ